MKLVDLKFQPGVDKQDTAYSAGDQRKYVDSDFVRFHYGKPKPCTLKGFAEKLGVA